MNTQAFKSVCHDFAQVAAPYLHIKDASHYEESLVLIQDYSSKSKSVIMSK